ncbi:DNA polymerase III subunit delta' [bacterium]|nr:DNA polymerase III subunit delta' [bacterium]
MPLVDLLGQVQARERLMNMIVRGRVPQSLLFTGPEGVGKNLAAILFAQALSCRESTNGDACGKCPSCIQVSRKIYPDILTIAADNQQIKIEQVSEIQEFISFAPLVGERRIVIIKDAHKLNHTAANALLKTLEEPAPTVLFILLSHRHNLLLATILSRCLRLSFVSLQKSVIVEIIQLQNLAEEYGEVGAHGIAEAAAWSGGSMGRALFFLAEGNLGWCSGFIEKFSRLPQETLLAALDLAEVAAQFEEREVLFFILRSFLHDALLAARGVVAKNPDAAHISALSWAASVALFAPLHEQRILLIRQQLLVVEQAQAINVNLKLAFEAFFTAIVTGTS